MPHGEDPRPRHELPESGVDQDHEARHDRHVSVPPRLREVQPELEIKTHSHLSDQNQKPDIWLVDKWKAIDVGVIQPRQMDAYYNEKVKKYRDGTLPIIYGTDGSLHPSPRGTSRSSTWTSVRAAFVIAYMAAEANEHLTKLIRRAGPKAWSPRATVSCHPTSDNRMNPPLGPDDNDRKGAQDWTHNRVESQPEEKAPLAAADIHGQY
ncbi:Dihydrolipoamide acyltransferase [Giardia duodenalis]|uniref:Dihydrolipoamide acyltransferase n=1 Tax=Giardia intestinalis TaxID=5741 RepID=V6T8D3_GIAIN|nr:Dihydrolipoamide acyltransferase [Giardia intestinalis]